MAFWEQTDPQAPERYSDFIFTVELNFVLGWFIRSHSTGCSLRGLPRPLRCTSGASVPGVAAISDIVSLISSSILTRLHIDSTHTLCSDKVYMHCNYIRLNK